jgi:light-regulated signal transduction histidine kinase (bacteriophytochrome)
VILRNEQGKAVRLVGSQSDISYLKEYERSLKKLNEDLESQTRELIVSNAELEQFAYVASHDLQEPLRMITSFLTKLDDKFGSQLNDKAKQYLDFAVDGASRMRQNILDLLQYSRVGKGDSELENINIKEVIDEVILLHQTDISECNAEIISGPMPNINNFMAPVVQVFSNLISNAIKYRKPDEKPVIRISARSLDNSWEFAISDNGIGIPNEYLQKIFVIFQRLHPKEKYGGTGIGLAVVKKIVENLGGKVWVESVPGNGSTFYFTLKSINKNN